MDIILLQFNYIFFILCTFINRKKEETIRLKYDKSHCSKIILKYITKTMQ